MSRPAHRRPFRPTLLTGAACLVGLQALTGCAPLAQKAEASKSPAVKPPATAASAAPPPAVAAAANALMAALAAQGPALAASSAAPRPTATPAPAGVPSMMAATPPAPPPFATVIKDARRIDGPLTLWQREDRVWIELTPAQFGRAFLLSPKIRTGIGEGWILGGLMGLPINGVGGPQVVEFVRVNNQIRLQARNTEIVVAPNTPEARAVASSYTTSLIASTPVVSGPHPDRKSVLIDANSIFLDRDHLGMGQLFQRSLRQSYGLDRGNSLITAVRSNEQAIIVETQMHFAGGGGGVNPAAAANPLAALLGPSPLTPRFVPDPRSLLIGLHFSLAPLPEKPMPTRRADPRVGLFNNTVLNFSSDLQASPRERHIVRWRLEKKDPAAERSEPVKPITFWIDRNVPLAYRETVRGAILEWNKAFDRIGFIDAIRVEQQPDDAKFDTLDFGRASVRWMLNADPLFGAIGPNHHDPRTGEILDANIAFEGLSARGVRALRAQVLPGSNALGAETGQPLALLPEPAREPLAVHAHQYCQHGMLAAEQVSYAMDVLAARGEMEPDSPMAQQFVLDYIRDAIMHEVGHVLGLRHNFRASRAYTEAQLSDPEFTRAHGTTGSVMEYNAVNLPLPGKTGGMAFQHTLGPYDYWAIEYAYKPMPAGTTAAAEKTELLRIAARSKEPLLAYGTDEDIILGLDPETIQLDLGNDPLAFATKRLAIAKDLFQRQETRVLTAEQDYAVLRRSLAFALSDATRALGVLARQIGGVVTLRDFPGSGRDPLQPVPAAVQRQAAELMIRATLSPEGLQISPALQRRLAPDFLDRAESLATPTDFAVPQRLLDLQRAVLGYLMHEAVAARVLDSAAKVDRASEALEVTEIYQRVSDAVWSELRSGGSISASRRELQRDYVNRLAMGVVRPAGRTEVRGYARMQARSLVAQLEAAQRRGGKALDSHTRAHLTDAVDTLRQALNAGIQRMAL